MLLSTSIAIHQHNAVTGHHAVRHPVHAPAAVSLHAHLLFDPRPIAPHYLSPSQASGSRNSSLNSNANITTAFTGNSGPLYGFTPQQMRGAYGLTGLSINGLTGNGSGQTIAIVDPYDDPSFVNSTSSTFGQSDLALFDNQFGLPNPPSFIKYGVNDTTDTVTTTLPGTDPAGPARTTGNLGAELEESLDVEWAHALAPNANLILIETSGYNDLYDGVAAADNLGTVGIVSMSFGGPESQISSATEQSFQNVNSPNGIFAVPGITYVASSGDSGAYNSNGTTITPQIPAALTNVVAAGGTTLSVSGTSYAGETTWGNGTASGTSGGGGGGLSLYESQPAYQSGVTNAISTTRRAYPDISMDANPGSGVPVLDSWDLGSGTGWYPGTIGGTSLSAPMFAALVAITNQGRSAANLAPLDSSGQAGDVDLHTLLYKLTTSPGTYSADYHDISTGNPIGPTSPSPSYAPGTGYDLATGLGSPVGNRLLPDLAAPVPVPSFTVNDGTAQRSEVKSLTVTFNTAVTLQPCALTLSQRAGQAGAAGGTVPLVVSNPSGDGKTYLITFSGSSGPALDYGSLPDGVYDLTAHAALVTNVDGLQMATDATLTFHRLFGDVTGDGIVNNLDAYQFQSAYATAVGGPAPGYNSAVDFNADGVVNNLDAYQFQLRYATQVSPP